MVAEDVWWWWWWWNEGEVSRRSELGRTHILGSLGHRAAMLQRERPGTNSGNAAVIPMASKSPWDKGARENSGESTQPWGEIKEQAMPSDPSVEMVAEDIRCFGHEMGPPRPRVVRPQRTKFCDWMWRGRYPTRLAKGDHLHCSGLVVMVAEGCQSKPPGTGRRVGIKRRLKTLPEGGAAE